LETFGLSGKKGKDIRRRRQDGSGEDLTPSITYKHTENPEC
jgi:hypothetical protein